MIVWMSFCVRPGSWACGVPPVSDGAFVAGPAPAVLDCVVVEVVVSLLPWRSPASPSVMVVVVVVLGAGSGAGAVADGAFPGDFAPSPDAPPPPQATRATAMGAAAIAANIETRVNSKRGEVARMGRYGIRKRGRAR